MNKIKWFSSKVGRFLFILFMSGNAFEVLACILAWVLFDWKLALILFIALWGSNMRSAWEVATKWFRL